MLIDSLMLLMALRVSVGRGPESAAVGSPVSELILIALSGDVCSEVGALEVQLDGLSASSEQA